MDPIERARCAFSTSPSGVDDAALVERIQRAYRSSCESFTPAKTFDQSQWSTINQAKAAAHEILFQGSLEEAATLLRFPSQSNFFYGFDVCGPTTPSLFGQQSSSSNRKQPYICPHCSGLVEFWG
jgi:hypothetical protein